MLTIIAEWVSYLKTLLTVMAFTSQQKTYQQPTMVGKSGKNTIDLTLNCGLKNIKALTKYFTLIKTILKS